MGREVDRRTCRPVPTGPASGPISRTGCTRGRSRLTRRTLTMGEHDQDDRQTCDSPRCGCGPQPVSIGRRDFLAVAGLGAAAALLVPDWPAVAGPFEEKDFEQLVPRDKKLNPDWVRKLTERGKPETYRGRRARLDRHARGRDRLRPALSGGRRPALVLGHLHLDHDHRLRGQDLGGAALRAPAEAEAGRRAGFAIRVKQGGDDRPSRASIAGASRTSHSAASTRSAG